MIEEVFAPDLEGTVGAAVTSTAATVALPVRNSNATLLITNDGSAAVLIKFGTSSSMTAVTDTTGIPILPGTQIPLQVKKSVTHVSVKTRSDAGTIAFTAGIGQ